MNYKLYIFILSLQNVKLNLKKEFKVQKKSWRWKIKDVYLYYKNILLANLSRKVKNIRNLIQNCKCVKIMVATNFITLRIELILILI